MKKILITNNHLHTIGGSETAAYTLAVELKRKGHDVHYFTLNRGITSGKMEEAGIKRYQTGDLRFDLIIASHNTTITALKAAKVTGVYVNICHGTIPELEQPHPNADFYVGISEEVIAHLRGKVLSEKIRLIRNGIDLNRFRPGPGVEDFDDIGFNVLSLCQGKHANRVLEKVCEQQSVSLRILNKFANPVWEVERQINWADMVFTLGRGAMEAMACNKPVFVADSRDYMGSNTIMGDGLMSNKITVGLSVKYNYSGRWGKFNCGEFAIKRAIYNLKRGQMIELEGREWVKKHHDIRETGNQYLELLN